MMNDTPGLILAGAVGLILGGIFFGGLWWTVRRSVASKHPALWFLGSTLVRVGVVLTGIYFVSAGHWERMLTCLLGFIIARLIITRVTRAVKIQRVEAEKADHAHQS